MSLLTFNFVMIYIIHKILLLLKNYLNYLKDKRYLNKIRPCLKNIINNLKKSDTWKIQLRIANNFISSIDNDEECVMHSNYQHY